MADYLTADGLVEEVVLMEFQLVKVKDGISQAFLMESQLVKMKDGVSQIVRRQHHFEEIQTASLAKKEKGTMQDHQPVQACLGLMEMNMLQTSHCSFPYVIQRLEGYP